MRWGRGYPSQEMMKKQEKVANQEFEIASQKVGPQFVAHIF